MSYPVEQVLGLLNLGLDLPLLMEITQTVRYIQTQQPYLEIKELQVIAVAALLSQNKRLLAVDNNTLVSVGLSIQSFLSRISIQKRQTFIDLLKTFSLKWHICSQTVKQKINYLKKVYSLYLSYHINFVKISINYGFSAFLSETLSALFWLAYIQRGIQVKVINEENKQKTMLMNYLKWIFITFFRKSDCSAISQLLQIQQNKIQQNKLQEFQSQVSKNLQKICQITNLNRDDLSFELLENNQAEILLYEYSRYFAEKYEFSDLIQIKFTQFFNLGKSLSPRPKPRISYSQETAHSISQKIIFDLEEQDWNFSEEQGGNENKSKQDLQAIGILENHNKSYDNHLLSSCNHQIIGKDRLSALSWLNKIKNIKGENFKKCENYFKNTFSQDFSEFLKNSQKIVQKFINKIAPSCLQVQNKSKKIISVFQSFILTVLDNKINLQVRELLQSLKYLNGFLFVSILLVFAAYKVPLAQLNLCLKQLAINPQEAFIPLSWIGSYADLPRSLRTYIIQIQKDLLLQQLWKEGKGYLLLQDWKKQKKTSNKKQMMNKLKIHIKNLVHQICQENEQLCKQVLYKIHQIQKNYLKIFGCNTLQVVIFAAFGLASSKNSIEEAEKSAFIAYKKIKDKDLSFFNQKENQNSFSQFLSELQRKIKINEDLNVTQQQNKRTQSLFVLMQPSSILQEEKKN